MRHVLVICWILLALPAAVSAVPETYVVSPGPPQSVRFEAQTQTERYGGHTDQITGQISVDTDQPTHVPSARFDVVLAPFSTGNGSRDSNMRRSFLETLRFPTASFRLSALAASGMLAPGRPVHGQAEGTFTLHGVTRPIQVPLVVTRSLDNLGNETLHIQAQFVVRLKEYHIRTPRFLFFSVRQEHPVFIDILAVSGNRQPEKPGKR